ncbi:hypothetical protein DDQ41_27260 [Streptomyces spongiicola]|uniref:Uncharacterized protein n=1 Tax=Streptomyces spongiicola TaxID=1690221 RepID=A0ABM6VE26_9ACTN|nr:hypothetical protein DDQ41_27260 [Streptomyces spongiicola]
MDPSGVHGSRHREVRADTSRASRGGDPPPRRRPHGFSRGTHLSRTYDIRTAYEIRTAYNARTTRSIRTTHHFRLPDTHVGADV